MKKQLLFSSLFLGALFTVNAQTTSFEEIEGFTLGAFGATGQNGWTIAGATMPVANVSIADDYASDGLSSLKVVGSNTQSTTLIGVYSPDYTIADAKITVSQDIYIPALGGSDVYIDALDVEGANLYLTSRVILDYQGDVTLVTGVANGALVYTDIAEYAAGDFVNIKVEYDFIAPGAIKYYLNGTLIHTGTVYNGVQVDRLAFRYDNYTTGFNVDNVSIAPTVLAVADNQLASNVSIFPNPASNVVNVSADKSQINNITITDLNGRIVKQNTVNNLSKVELNISDLSSGVYMMNVKSNNGSVTKKIVKN